MPSRTCSSNYLKKLGDQKEHVASCGSGFMGSAKLRQLGKNCMLSDSSKQDSIGAVVVESSFSIPLVICNAWSMEKISLLRAGGGPRLDH